MRLKEHQRRDREGCLQRIPHCLGSRRTRPQTGPEYIHPPFLQNVKSHTSQSYMPLGEPILPCHRHFETEKVGHGRHREVNPVSERCAGQRVLLLLPQNAPREKAWWAWEASLCGLASTWKQGENATQQRELPHISKSTRSGSRQGVLQSHSTSPEPVVYHAMLMVNQLSHSHPSSVTKLIRHVGVWEAAGMATNIWRRKVLQLFLGGGRGRFRVR